MLGNQDVCEKDHYTFGRTSANDFVLEHPSSSRLHAVLQYNGETKAASLYDCGSTHGTYLNKQRIKPNIFVPLPVRACVVCCRLCLHDSALQHTSAQGNDTYSARQSTSIHRHAHMHIARTGTRIPVAACPKTKMASNVYNAHMRIRARIHT